METYTFPQFPSPWSTVHLALFDNLSNAPEIRRKLISAAQMDGPEGAAAKREVEFGFIDASMLVSRQHLITALQMTLLLALPADLSGSSAVVPKTRSHNLHSEILLTLHTNNIISEAIKKFGISDSTRTLCVVRFGSSQQADVWRDMEKVVQGQLVPLSKLDSDEYADWKSLDKLYKLSELTRLPLTKEEIREKKIAAVVNTVAVKSVT
ncbi:kinase binding protein CGI-121-domain-containing protein [Papiliotrema laurentii]|uniref:EKC/KEOPS complex subunit CGI121 n=1 Tax=Papiliotrema laurentii TaxID=5418 RepID=A0AAD9L8X1_PAPLA|nr:kinase binding protein CGI-121-domain-containing protein [Papiliotrema laurentii]